MQHLQSAVDRMVSFINVPKLIYFSDRVILDWARPPLPPPEEQSPNLVVWFSVGTKIELACLRLGCNGSKSTWGTFWQ